tara:strand:+ start:2089 stop:2649 length:561 start_codon:yes stop_codon:yes gene_type:complete
MKIITNQPVKFEADPLAASNEYWLMIDGKNDIQVRHFQAWANKEHGTGLKVNGRWNKGTRTEYAKLGSEWEKVFKTAFPDYVSTSPSGESRSGQLWDSAKGVWVTARETGLLQQGLDALGINFDTNSIQPPQPAPIGPVPEAPPAPAPKPKKISILSFVIPIAVILGGYFIYTKVTGTKSTPAKKK